MSNYSEFCLFSLVSSFIVVVEMVRVLPLEPFHKPLMSNGVVVRRKRKRAKTCSKPCSKRFWKSKSLNTLKQSGANSPAAR